jgi:hypothetical protein
VPCCVSALSRFEMLRVWRMVSFAPWVGLWDLVKEEQIDFQQTRGKPGIPMNRSLVTYGYGRDSEAPVANSLASNGVALAETFQMQSGIAVVFRKVLPASQITLSSRDPSVGLRLPVIAFTLAGGQTQPCPVRPSC